MRRLLLLVALAAATPAGAAPVFTNAILTVSIGFGTAPVTIGGSGFVDVTGSTVLVPAGLVTLGHTIVIPVTGTTSLVGFAPFSMVALYNLSGTFTLGGVTNQLPSELCNAGPAPGEACNGGGGIGGVMEMAGSMIWPFGFFSIPFDFDQMQIGRGGSTNIPALIDAAAWSTGTGQVAYANAVATVTGGGSPFNLVSPTFLSFLGFETPFLMSLTLTAVSLPVPEAGAALLVGSVGLVLLVWKRR